jgi:hypothetical protein
MSRDGYFCWRSKHINQYFLCMRWWFSRPFKIFPLPYTIINLLYSSRDTISFTGKLMLSKRVTSRFGISNPMGRPNPPPSRGPFLLACARPGLLNLRHITDTDCPFIFPSPSKRSPHICQPFSRVVSAPWPGVSHTQYSRGDETRLENRWVDILHNLRPCHSATGLNPCLIYIYYSGYRDFWSIFHSVAFTPPPPPMQREGSESRAILYRQFISGSRYLVKIKYSIWLETKEYNSMHYCLAGRYIFPMVVLWFQINHIKESLRRKWSCELELGFVQYAPWVFILK